MPASNLKENRNYLDLVVVPVFCINLKVFVRQCLTTDCSGNYVAGANLAAFEKLARVMSMQGVV